MTWDEVLRRDSIYLNLGGGRNCHPARYYENYIAVDMNTRSQRFAVSHDLRTPIPLPDGSVTRILTEEFIEHIPIPDIASLLVECHRLLKPGGLMRVACPDYKNPKDRAFFASGTDPRFPGHVTLTHYALIWKLVEASPFTRFDFYQYWDGDHYHWQAIDYSVGMIQRTPEHYYRVYMRGWRQQLHSVLLAVRHPRNSWNSSEIVFGHPLYATQVVVDLWK